MTATIGYGTWPLGGWAYGSVLDTEVRDALQTAYDAGIRLFDVANIYGDGRVERLIGEVFGGSETIKVLTKGGYLTEAGGEQDFSVDHLVRGARRSLSRLQRPVLDGFLLHSPPDEFINSNQIGNVLEQIAMSGVAREVGISVRTVEQGLRALELPNVAWIEVILNLLDQRAIDAGLLARAAQSGIKVIARVPLCFGFLTGKFREQAVFGGTDHRTRWSGAQIELWRGGAERFRHLERPERSMAHAAIAFCLQSDGVHCVIPGMKSVRQVAHNVRASSTTCRLSHQEWHAARSTWTQLTHVPPGSMSHQ